jgi:hypothetical protein
MVIMRSAPGRSLPARPGAACPPAHAVRLLHLDVQFGRRDGVGQVLERRIGVGPARHDLEQAGAGVEAVVEAVPALLEEDVAAHLAGQRRAGFLELGLDQRVAGIPHQRLAALAIHSASQRCI